MWPKDWACPGIDGRARSYMRKEFLDLQRAVSGLVEERHRLSADHEKIKELKIELRFFPPK